MIASRPASFEKPIPSFARADLKSKTQSSVSAEARESSSPWSRPKAYRCNASAISYRSQANCAKSSFIRFSVGFLGPDGKELGQSTFVMRTFVFELESFWDHGC